MSMMMYNKFTTCKESLWCDLLSKKFTTDGIMEFGLYASSFPASMLRRS